MDTLTKREQLIAEHKDLDAALMLNLLERACQALNHNRLFIVPALGINSHELASEIGKAIAPYSPMFAWNKTQSRNARRGRARRASAKLRKDTPSPSITYADGTVESFVPPEDVQPWLNRTDSDYEWEE